MKTTTNIIGLIGASAVVGACLTLIACSKVDESTAKSNPAIEFKPVSCIDTGELWRCHDSELHVTCYRNGTSSTLSCVPDQWTYRDDEDEQTKTQK